MTTINISLPDKLKVQGQSLVDNGFYASFSDLVRDALRKVVVKNKYDLLAEETMRDIEEGTAIAIRSKKDLKKYFDTL